MPTRRRLLAHVSLVAASLVAAPVAAPARPTDRVVVLGGTEAVAPGIVGGVEGCVPDVDRVAGTDRFATAVAVAARRPDAHRVYLASGRAFADGLAAGPVVASDDAVLLLTEPDRLPPATRDDLVRRAPAEVVVLGGTAAVTEEVVDEVAALGLATRRVAGRDRYATAARLAQAVAPGAERVVVATGDTFADALAIGPVAARDGAPILLVGAGRLPPTTEDALRRLAPREVVVVGGDRAVADAVVDRIAQVTGVTPRRVAGADRRATAVAIASTFFPDRAGSVTIATGGGFADALAAGPVVEGPLLLVGRDLDVTTARELLRHAGESCDVVTVTPDAVEGLTLGPTLAGPPATLTASALGGEVVLDAPTDTGALLRPSGAGAIGVELAYPSPDSGVAPVAWTQRLAGDATELVARQAWRGRRPPPPDGVTLAWQYTGDSDRYRREVDAAPGLTVTAPFRWYLDGSGQLVGRADRAFIADMHARGIDVWPTIHTCGAPCIHAALADPDRRAALAATIADDAVAAGADGVQIDIEGFHDADGPAVTAFVQELSARVQPHGLVTSFDFTVLTDSWHTPPDGYAFWSTAPQRRAISEAVDYAVLMAYDQFNRYRPAGPVASPAWVEEALRFQLRHTDPDRLLLGVPLYGRVWAGASPTAVGIGTIEQHVRDGVVVPDPALGVDRVHLPDGRVTWAETVAGLQHRVDLVEAYGLAGTASWRLGFDTPAVWSVLGARP